ACGAHQLHVGIAEAFAAATKAHPALGVRPDDLDRLAERLDEAGCLVQWDDAIPGTRRFYTADPWGNRIQLVAVVGQLGRGSGWLSRVGTFLPRNTAASVTLQPSLSSEGARSRAASEASTRPGRCLA